MQWVEVKGAKIPAVGFGTITLKGDVCVQAVVDAARLGYRHFDTATFYGNELEVGEGLRNAGVPRNELFVTTKVRHTNLAPGDFERSVEGSLKALGLDAVDLLLIHWPNPQVPQADSIGGLCSAKRNGLTKHIGVANFTVPLLEEAVGLATEPLVTNQVEVHPFLDQSKVIATCRKHGLSVTAYCPLARGQIPSSETLARIGKAHGKSASQTSLRYLLQMGLITLPRSTTPAHMQENIDVFDFQLSDTEMAQIKQLSTANLRMVDPPHRPQWDT
jgi:diketogulonate reductase-like aldo/keto reductase